MTAVTIHSDFGAQKKNVCHCFLFFLPSICHEVMGLDAKILVFWMLSLKPTPLASWRRTIQGAGVVTRKDRLRKRHESGWWLFMVSSHQQQLGSGVESELPGQRSWQHSGCGVSDTKTTFLCSEFPGLFLLCGNQWSPLSFLPQLVSRAATLADPCRPYFCQRHLQANWSRCEFCIGHNQQCSSAAAKCKL